METPLEPPRGDADRGWFLASASCSCGGDAQKREGVVENHEMESFVFRLKYRTS